MTSDSTFVAATPIHSVTHMRLHMEYELYVIALKKFINTPFCNKCVFTLLFVHCLVISIYSLNYLAIWYTCTTLTHLRTMPHRLVRYSLCTYKSGIQKIAKMLVYPTWTVYDLWSEHYTAICDVALGYSSPQNNLERNIKFTVNWQIW